MIELTASNDFAFWFSQFIYITYYYPAGLLTFKIPDHYARHNAMVPDR